MHIQMIRGVSYLEDMIVNNSHAIKEKKTKKSGAQD